MQKFQINLGIHNTINSMVVVMLLFLINLPSVLKAQDKSIYIYGEVETINNNYKGFIRWGDEEVFWFDYFNGTKLENGYYHKHAKKDKKDEDSWFDINLDIRSIWEDRKSSVEHVFSCEFGEIKSMNILGRSKVKLELHNGEFINVGGGSNDFGETIVVLDEEIGEVKLRWNKITKVKFLRGSKSNGEIFGKALYGKVNTFRKGSFTGYIQWDKDERVSEDLLDGDNRDGDVSIAFGKISNIRKERNGCAIELNSGRNFFLTGSNDVNSGNRGILVYQEGIGEVEIPWKSFSSLELFDQIKNPLDVQKYSSPDMLEGKVYLYDNSVLEGKIIYDLDETWEFESLDGDDDEIKYKIPFRNIKRIKPKNYDYSMVTFRNQETLLLGKARDISDRNGGLLVIEEKQNDPQYVAWEEISEIVFN